MTAPTSQPYYPLVPVPLLFSQSGCTSGPSCLMLGPHLGLSLVLLLSTLASLVRGGAVCRGVGASLDCAFDSGSGASTAPAGAFPFPSVNFVGGSVLTHSPMALMTGPSSNGPSPFTNLHNVLVLLLPAKLWDN